MIELDKLDNIPPTGMPLTGPEYQILGRAIGLVMDLTHPAQDIAFAGYRSAVREAHERVELPNDSMRAQLEHWRMRPAVGALMTLRGIDLMAPMTVVGEFGDFTRFARAERNRSDLCSKPKCSPAIVLWQRHLIRSQAASQKSCRRSANSSDMHCCLMHRLKSSCNPRIASDLGINSDFAGG